MRTMYILKNNLALFVILLLVLHIPILGNASIGYSLVGTDPREDIKIVLQTVLVNEGSNNTPLNSSEYAYVDLKAAYITHNDTTLFLKIVVWGEIKDSDFVTYSWSFKSNDTQWQKKPVLYTNGTATFWDWDVKTYHVEGILFLEVPIEYLRNEGCIHGQNIQTISVGAIKGGNNEDDIVLSDYIDNYVKKYYSLQSTNNNPFSFYVMITLIFVGSGILIGLIVMKTKNKKRKSMIDEGMIK